MVAGAGLAAALIPGASEFLQYDRTAVESGAYWRLLSGQLVHWTARMTVVDLLVLLIAGAWLESRSRRVAVWTFVATGVLVGLTIHAWTPGLSHYRGSSGIASGLFVAAAVGLLANPRPRWIRSVALAALLLLAAKIAWEMAAGGALVAGELPPGVTVVPAVHLAGALAGVLCVVGMARPERFELL
jgi:rhomboid family GlyGly-CTERM serine protease